MKKVFVLLQERETSIECKMIGVFEKRESANRKAESLICKNELYDENSNLDFENGLLESDPNYESDEYCNYLIIEAEIQ